MIDRDKVVAVLRRRFSDATSDIIASTANAIVGLDDEWEEVTERVGEFGFSVSPDCKDICYLAEEIQNGALVRVYRRREEFRDPSF